MTVLVLAIAFLAASFVARNADIWLHLATGRLIARGAYSFSADPFAYTTAGVYWTNHAWLYDLGLYLLYTSAGGAGLVIAKAALIAGLAGVMLLVRRPGASGRAPAFCTALAVLVMSPRLLLAPVCVSLAFLGLTLWILWRFRDAERRPRLDPRFLLPPLFALWVNLDEWFLLGPVLVGLFWVGDRMRRPARPTPAWLLPACLLACLCGPHTWHVFTPPAELWPGPSFGPLIQDVRFQRLSASPWGLDGHFRPHAGANIAGLAYFVLVAVGLASFLLNRPGLRDWRGLAFGAFALLGSWQLTLVPFFAVVAGPVAALNLQEAKLQPRGATAGALRAACLLSLIILVGLAVPGWQLGFGQRARVAAWDVEVDPSLRRAAQTLQGWRDKGLLRDSERSFAFHPDVACYCAWFAPNEKSYIDPRFYLFGRKASDYVKVCREIDPSLAVAGARLPQDDRTALPDVFGASGVAVLVAYDPDPSRLLSVVGSLNRNSNDWTLLAVDGQAVIFGWKPARPGEAFAGLRFDAARAAFADEDGGAAPARGPGRDPEPPGWAAPFVRQRAAPWESAAASVYLRLFDDADADQRRAAVDRYYLTAAAGYAGLTGLPPAAGAPGHATSALFRLAALDETLAGINDRPPELPLLAVRAARRAVAAEPDDANAYLRLGQAYLALRGETAERSRGADFSPLLMLRYVQIVTALRQALILNPGLEAAHQHLALLFAERQFYDASLDHFRAWLDLARRAGPRPGEDAAAFQRRLDPLEQQVRDMERQVQDSQDQFAIQSRTLGDEPLARAEMALHYGLARQALDDVLMQSRVELFGTAGARRELELMLLMGRAAEARPLLDDADMKANRAKLTTYEVPFVDTPGPGRPVYVFPAYEWLLACEAAALGDYDPADGALGQIDVLIRAEERADDEDYTRSLPLVAAVEVGSLARPGPAPLPILLSRRREMERRGHYLEAERADLLALRGLLGLERWAPDDGLGRLQESVALSRSAKDAGADCPGRPLALEYLRHAQTSRTSRRGGP